MSSSPVAPRSKKPFAPFDLTRLLKTVFAPKNGERVCLLIDLDDPQQVKQLQFLNTNKSSPQHYAYEVFYRGLHDKTMKDLGLLKGNLYAYKTTGGSNLDLPDEAWTPEGKKINLLKDVYPHYDIILCISKYSATAPLTAYAKEFGFRGATLHGLNKMILNTGLAVDYQEISNQAERLRQGLNHPTACEIDFVYEGKTYMLHLDLGKQDAQKSHGLSREKGEIANLPAGEIYFVPNGAEGQFPLLYSDGTIGLMSVHEGRIQKTKLLKGNQKTIDLHQQKLQEDPLTGHIGELGLGTQDLPFAGADIQDEKIVGTIHVATGRNDHLGGRFNSKSFARRENATHDDILYSPQTTPGINIKQARMYWGDKMKPLIENYEPLECMTKYLHEANYAHHR